MAVLCLRILQAALARRSFTISSSSESSPNLPGSDFSS